MLIPHNLAECPQDKQTDTHTHTRTHTHTHTHLYNSQAKNSRVIDGLDGCSGNGEDVRGKDGWDRGMTRRTVMKQKSIDQWKNPYIHACSTHTHRLITSAVQLRPDQHEQCAKLMKPRIQYLPFPSVSEHK